MLPLVRAPHFQSSEVILAVVAPPAGSEVAANRLAAGSQHVPELRASAVDDREGRAPV